MTAPITARPLTRVVGDEEVPLPGRYEIDPSHTTVEFIGRYLMLTKVRGRFTRFSGHIDVAADPSESSVEVTVEPASLETHDERRDQHLRSEDFLAVDQHPQLTFRSTGVARDRKGWSLAGDLTIRGVTRPVNFDLTFDGTVADPWGGRRIGFSAATEIDREDWGLTWNAALESGGVLVGRKVGIEIVVQAVAAGD